MIERIVLIKLLDEFANDGGRQEVAAETRRVLPNLPGVESATVGVPADPGSEASWDICIAARFASMDAIEAYLPHPDHRRYVDEFLRPRMACIKAWNFTVG